MKKNRIFKQILLPYISILIILLFSGCSIISLDKKEPEKKFYSFNQINSLQQSIKSKTLLVTLVLMDFTSTSEFNTDQFIYKKKNQYIKDYYNRFFLPPEKMIQTQCTEWLKNTDLFKKISTESQLALSDFVLKGKLLEIYCDLTNSSASYAIIKIQFSLIKYDKTDKIVMQKDLYSRVEFKNFSSENLVNAWTKCLENIFQNLESEISSHI